MGIGKVWSGNYQKEGYDEGIKDSKNNKPNLAGLKFFKVANPINWLWNFNRAYDTFVNGYKDGYLDGDRVNNQVYTKENKMDKLDEGHGLEAHIEEPNTKNSKKSTNKTDNIKQKTANALFSNFAQSWTLQRDLAEFFINELYKITNKIDEIDAQFIEEFKKMEIEEQFQGIVLQLFDEYKKNIFPIVKELEENISYDIAFLIEEQEKLKEPIKLYGEYEK